ncbi:hypothetical protein PZH32_06185 [Adlercreutzia equolifaciens]|uniref:hypothetical protein n=1 Tax=Adlercreutzia equolifaciens TaxID=446660 RepID=UPI0023AECED1|nr:hypothetical protein [Adlercreutzia equolifaciens]MDE8702547.1 hypothetical protein [Adlercreutzia equolifaciens]
MGTAKTIAAVAVTLTVLAASILVPPQFSQLQDRQMTGQLHVEADHSRPTVASSAPNLLERLQVFDGDLEDDILTLAQPLGDEELERWTERFRASRQSLVDEGLLDASLAEEPSNTESWGNRTLYWDPAGDTAVSTVSIFQSSTDKDDAYAHEGWMIFDEASGSPVAFIFGPANTDAEAVSISLADEEGEGSLVVEHADNAALTQDETSGSSAEAIDPERYAQWLAAQWGLTLERTQDGKKANCFEVADTGVNLTVDAALAPFAVEVILGTPAESLAVISDAKSTFDWEFAAIMNN